VQQEDKDDTMHAVSDGKNVFQKFGDRPGKSEPKKEDIGAYVRGAMGRVGVLFSLMRARPAPKEGTKPEKLDAAKDFPASNFKLGKDGMVEGRAVKEISYAVEREEKGDSPPFRMVLQVDAKTLLPVRRTVTIAEKGMEVTLVETYEVTIDPRLEPDTFTVPAAEGKEKE
jgi:hypothetical protein